MDDMEPMQSRHVSVVIEAHPDEVLAVAGDPTRLPEWAAGLAGSVVMPDGSGGWRTDSPMGAVTFTFTAPNPYGVLDHTVTLPDGSRVHNPLRVMPHPRGAEVLFTVRQLSLSDAEFERDSALVADDLARLRALVESDRLATGRRMGPGPAEH